MFTFKAGNDFYQVKFHHSPYNSELDNKLAQRQSTCIIRNTVDNSIVTGVAECSKKDNFNKVKGRELAFARALLLAFPGQEGKAIRTQMWMQYFMKLELDQTASYIKEDSKIVYVNGEPFTENAKDI